MRFARILATSAVISALTFGTVTFSGGCSDTTPAQKNADESEQKQMQNAMQSGFQKPVAKKSRTR